MVKRNLLLFVLFFCTGIFLPAAADTWKVFFYMDSTDDLGDMAFKNITDMLRGRPNDGVEFVIQLHAYDQVAIRYQVIDGALIFVQEVTLSGDSKQDFIDASDWAFSDLQADNAMLIVSNHGWGILDPQWNDETEKWQAGNDALSNACFIQKGYSDMFNQLHAGDRSYACNQLGRQYNHMRHKGFMFSANPRTYLNNQDLIDSLAYITENIMGKPFDILAFDTCMGDMFEVGYHVAPYAHYLVGNQSCALRDGFDYKGVMHLLNQGLTPYQTAVGMVRVFDDYYSKNDASGIYTHAALDLSQMYNASEALDLIIMQLLEMPELTPLFTAAADASPRFCMWPMYTDLVAFCKCVEKQIKMLELSDDFLDLEIAFKIFYEAMQSLVVARCGGFTTQGFAHGAAIYLPTYLIDDSYYATLFASESLWINLLQMMCDSRAF